MITDPIIVGKEWRLAPWPWMTAIIAGLAVLAWVTPGAAQALQFERTAIAQGELWRLVTGHLTHWTRNHLVWDLGMFLVLGAVLERRTRRGYAAVLAASALAVSASIWVLEDGLETYRGLSGVDSALFVAVVIGSIQQASVRPDWRQLAPWLALLGFAAKTGWELVHGSSVFVAADAAFVPVASAHLIGAVAGAVTVPLARVRARRDSWSSLARSTPATPHP